LVVRLAVRGIAASVGVCGTQLEEAAGRWTGRIIGDAMFGEAKARAVRRIASQSEFDLSRCYAYGNCISDRWMLEAVGQPVAVNPSRSMERLARRRGWMVVRWAERDESTMHAPAKHARDEAERVA
jgi:phosphoserine phosphatase